MRRGHETSELCMEIEKNKQKSIRTENKKNQGEARLLPQYSDFSNAKTFSQFESSFPAHIAQHDR